MPGISTLRPPSWALAGAAAPTKGTATNAATRAARNHFFIPDPPFRRTIPRQGREHANFNGIHPGWIVRDWNARLLAWLDHWLKGRGPKPELGVASFQDGTGRWHRSTSWPPREAQSEVLHLAGDALAARPASADVSVRSLPRSPENVDAFRAACADARYQARSRPGVCS